MHRVVNVMQFNIEYGGRGVDFSSVSKAIRAADADVVVVQEACATMPDIASDLRWQYWDARTHVVSKYPLLTAQPVRRGAILVEVEPGQVFGVVNIHPPSRGYGPTRAAEGHDADAIVRRERRLRMPDLQTALGAADEFRRQGISVVLLGDFNTPSHRDWTAATVGQRPHLTQVVEWPLSVELEANGFTDVYRAIYPDPVRDPGLTWPAKRPFVRGYNPALRDEPADRIDLMFRSSGISPEAITIVGETESQFSQIMVDPWPSDHRALVAQLDIELAQPPILVSVDRRSCDVGTIVQVRVAGVSGPAQVSLVGVGKPLTKPERLLTLNTAGREPLSLSTALLAAGEYDFVLHEEDRELARAQLWLKDPGASPTLHLDKEVYAEREPIVATWNFGPGNKSDIIALYDAETDPTRGNARLWEYAMGKVSGSFTFDESLRRKRWPLPAGSYLVALQQDDSSITLARQPLVVASMS